MPPPRRAARATRARSSPARRSGATTSIVSRSVIAIGAYPVEVQEVGAGRDEDARRGPPPRTALPALARSGAAKSSALNGFAAIGFESSPGSAQDRLAACASSSTPFRRSRPSKAVAVDHQRPELESGDGNRFAAFAALPEEPSDAGVVDPAGRARAVPLLRGARPALRRARHCGCRHRLLRPHGRVSASATDDFEYPAHRAQTTPEGVQADVRAGVELVARPGDRRDLHGRLLLRRPALMARCSGGHGLQGAVGFYGMPGRRLGRARSTARRRWRRRSSPSRAAPTRTSRPSTTPAFDDALTDSRRRARGRHRTLGAPHSFFDRKQAEPRGRAPRTRWNRTLAFIERRR